MKVAWKTNSYLKLKNDLTSVEDDLMADKRCPVCEWEFPPAITETYWEMGLTYVLDFYAFGELIS